MKILYTLNSGNPGGMEQHTVDLVSQLNSRGHRIYVWCKDGPITAWFEHAGATVETKDIKFDLDPVYIFHLYKYLRQNKIDVIHAHELKAVVNSLIAGFLARVPVRISHTHTPLSTWQISKSKKKLNVFIYSLVVNLLGTKEIALTESRKKVKISEGIKTYKLAVIPNGLDPEKYELNESMNYVYQKEVRERFQLPSDAYVFGNISRLTIEKGHSVLLEAFKNLLEYSAVDKEKTYLFIAGGGKLGPQLQQQAVDLGISNKVIFTGVFDIEDKVKFFSIFNSFIFPSLAEGFGIVLIEAMYMGCSVICSDLEVLQEVGGSSVIYFEIGSAHDLSEKMYNLYLKKDRTDELTKSARQRVLDLYTLQKFGDAYESLYTGLLEK